MATSIKDRRGNEIRKGTIIRWDIFYHVARVISIRKNRGRLIGHSLTVEILIGQPFYGGNKIGEIHSSQVGVLTREDIDASEESNKKRPVPLEGIDFQKLRELA